MKKITQIISVMLTVLMLFSSVGFTVSAQEVEHVAVFDCVVGENEDYFEFTPDEDGWYVFYTDCEYDTVADMYDGNGYYVGYSDDVGEDRNFRLKAYLTKDETYSLQIDAFEGDETVEFAVYVDKTAGAVSAVVTKEPDDTTVIENCEFMTMKLDGIEIEFTLSDGRKFLWSYDEDNVVDGSVVYYDCESDDEGNYYAYFVCDDAYVEQYFIAVETPVDRVEYKGSAVKYYENTEGYYDDYLGYYVYDEKLSEGSEIVIYYKDGTSETIEYDSPDGFKYGYLYSTQYEIPWVLGDDNSLILFYLGAETFIPVTVVESSVESIEVTKAPAKTVYESRYYPVWDGAEITVNFKDGTSVSAVVNRDNTDYCVDEDGDLLYEVAVGDHCVEISRMYDYEYDEEYYSLYCEGLTEYYEDFDFTESRGVKDITVEKFSPTGKGMTLTVYYETGETETFEFDDVLDYYESDDYLEEDADKNVMGYVMTDNGIAWYSIEPVYNDYLILDSYSIWFLGCYGWVDVIQPANGIIGDANGDDEVNIKDATAIQKHLAMLELIADERIQFADADGDDVLTIKDATVIQKCIAGIVEGIG